MDGCKVLLCVVLLDTNRYLSCWCRAASGDMNYLGALLDLQSVPGRDVSSFHSFFKPFFPFCFYQLPPPPPLLFLLSTLTPIFSSREFYQELSILLFSICTSSLVFLAFHSSVDPLVPVGSALHLRCCTTRAFASTILVQLPPLDVNGIKRLWPHNHSPLTLFLYRIALRCTCLLIQKYPFIL